MLPATPRRRSRSASSEAVGRRAVRDLEVAAVPELGQEWRDATEGRGDFETWAIWKLSKDLDIGTTRESSLLRVSFTSTDPEFAAKVANPWVKAYVDTTLELRVAPARQYREFFTASARQLREVLEVAQHRLSSFEQKHGLILSDEKLDMEIGRLDAMNAQLVLQIAQAADSNSRERQGRTGADSTQEALASKLVGDLRADLQRARSRLSELTPKLGDHFPEVVQLKAQIAELEVRIEEETRRIARGIDMTGRIGRQRLAEMQTAVDRQRAKVLKSKAMRDEAYVLQRDVQSAQQAYDNVLARGSQMALESQTAQTNALIVGQAAPPVQPASPKPLLVMATVSVIGLLAGLLLAFLRERCDQRIRTNEQAVALLQQPLIALLPHFGGTASSKLPRLAAPAGRRVRRLIGG